MQSCIRLSILASATALMLAGCSAGNDANAAPDASAGRSAVAPATTAAPTAQKAAPATTAAQAPSVQDVLSHITGKDGGGKSSYPVANGATINFWHGLDFEAGGKHWYTGFAWETPNKYGAARENNIIDPSAKVTLTHATYEASAPGAANPWTWRGSELWNGEFGKAERANEIDPSRKPQSWTSPSGLFVLALPSLVDASGGKAPAYEVLRFNPAEELQGTEERRWLHLGTIPAGNAGQAAGRLELASRQGMELPDVRISAAAGGDKPIEYRYDKPSKTYRPISR